MRRVRYSVATSLDGYIADSEGGYGWIPQDPAVDFSAFLGTVDTVLMGRHSFQAALKGPQSAGMFTEMPTYVFSTTLRQADYPDVTIVGEDPFRTVKELKTSGGKDIWLFGGGRLFGSLLEADLVDTVELGVVPVLLGEGVPLLQAPAKPRPLRFQSSEAFPSGLLLLKYVSGDGD